MKQNSDGKNRDRYAAEARAAWGRTDAYREYEERSNGRSEAENEAYAAELTSIFAGFGPMLGSSPLSPEAQSQVQKLRDFITEHYYRCTDDILCCLGRMYTADAEFRENIDTAGGSGTAAFVSRAIEAFCGGLSEDT